MIEINLENRQKTKKIDTMIDFESLRINRRSGNVEFVFNGIQIDNTGDVIVRSDNGVLFEIKSEELNKFVKRPDIIAMGLDLYISDPISHICQCTFRYKYIENDIWITSQMTYSVGYRSSF